MKKDSLCIGFLFFFFLMIDPYSVHAQIFDINQFEQLNGKWLQIKYLAKGVRFVTPTSPPEKATEPGRFYGCAYWDPTADWTGIEDAPWAEIDIYDEDGDFDGKGYLRFHAGTMENWGARFDMELRYLIHTVGIFTGKGDYTKKGQYSSFGSVAWPRNILVSAKIKAKVVSETKLPFSPPPCGWVAP